MVRPSQDNPVSKMLFPPRKEGLNEQVVSRIKRLIFSKELKIGEKLPSERELAARLRVSRVVVREALRSLEQSGLIEIRPGLTGGAFVVYNFHKPLFECVYDLFNGGSLTLSHFVEASVAIESFNIRRAAENATAESIDNLCRINDDMVADLRDKERFVVEHAAFHKAIASLSGNLLMSLIVQSLFELLRRLRPDFSRKETFMKETYKRHTAIIEALRQKDIPLCEELMMVDVEQTKKLTYAKPK